MDDERKSQLKTALTVLVRHNLWRKDLAKDMMTPQHITKAIDCACGAILDLLAISAEQELLSRGLSIAEYEWERGLKEIKEKDQEIRRLRSLLAAHKIKYAKK
jgi:hypothetical protein